MAESVFNKERQGEVKMKILIGHNNKAIGKTIAKTNGKNKKKNALILCHDRNRFWTTQKQFWQWAREGVVVKIGDAPLTGQFVNEDHEKMIVRANTILNLACPNHLSEQLAQRRHIAPR